MLGAGLRSVRGALGLSSVRGPGAGLSSVRGKGLVVLGAGLSSVRGQGLVVLAC